MHILRERCSVLRALALLAHLHTEKYFFRAQVAEKMI